ncbi:MAG TPA: hypothetical protein PK095_04910 [Myxococcota bacterium]|nr:hypothetical protein [Myxococcota bacterium]
MAEKTPKPPTPVAKSHALRGAHDEAPHARRGVARPAPHEKPWLDELDGLRTNAEGRLGTEDKRRDALVGGAEGLHREGKLEWYKEYDGYGEAGCVSLPFIAAAKAGLISMAQAVRLSQHPKAADGDIQSVILDIFGYVGWSKTPDSRKWGHPTCKPKKGDVALFVSKKNDSDFTHAALIASQAGDLYSLEPSSDGSPAKLRKSHITTYIAESKAAMTSDPEQPMTAQEADDALGCIICPFPF